VLTAAKSTASSSSGSAQGLDGADTRFDSTSAQHVDGDGNVLVDEVVLVGGASRTPAFRDMLRARFSNIKVNRRYSVVARSIGKLQSYFSPLPLIRRTSARRAMPTHQ
jgi:actin-related protein